VDGGVGVAGNPVYELCVEAFEYAGLVPEQTTVVSIGTGKAPAAKEVPNRNLLAKLSWVIGMLLDAPEADAPELVRRHYSKTKFWEFDIALDRKIDMADAGSVPELERYGERLADQIDWSKVRAGT
jgi:hypothetical protein